MMMCPGDLWQSDHCLVDCYEGCVILVVGLVAELTVCGLGPPEEQ